MSAGTGPEGGEDRALVSEEIDAPHLTAALLVVPALLLLIVGSTLVGRQAIHRAIPKLPPETWPARTRGLAVQAEVLRAPDEVPMFGTSELIRVIGNRADHFFAGAPTGFRIMPVGSPAMPLIQHALAIGALRDELRGRPVVLSLSSGEFAMGDTAQRWRNFEGNYSRLHAVLALTGGALPPDLTRDLARRLLAYDYVATSDAVVGATAKLEADESAIAGLARLALGPAQWLDVGWLRWVDIVGDAREARARRQLQAGRWLSERPIDWVRLDSAARRNYADQSNNNPFGMANDWWNQFAAYIESQRNSPAAQLYERKQETSPTWQELELTLRALDAVGARPLILAIPFHGAFMDFAGLPRVVRQRFYSRLDSIASRNHVPLQDFRDHEMDRGFLHDQDGHLSPAGWIAYDRAIDLFVHGLHADVPSH